MPAARRHERRHRPLLRARLPRRSFARRCRMRLWRRTSRSVPRRRHRRRRGHVGGSRLRPPAARRADARHHRARPDVDPLDRQRQAAGLQRDYDQQPVGLVRRVRRRYPRRPRLRLPDGVQRRDDRRAGDCLPPRRDERRAVELRRAARRARAARHLHRRRRRPADGPRPARRRDFRAAEIPSSSPPPSRCGCCSAPFRCSSSPAPSKASSRRPTSRRR